jgi:PA14 domain
MLHVFKPFNAFRRYTAAIALAAAFIGCTQIPTTDPSTARVNNVIISGLTGEYFDNIDFTGTKQTRVDATIDSAWGTTAPIAGITSDSYSVRWTGQIQPAFTEEYTFSLTSSGQVRLMINGVVLVNNWAEHASQVDTGKVSLQTNTKYDIRLEYARNAVQPALVKLEWQSTSQAKQVVPSAALFSGGYSVSDVINVLNNNAAFKTTGLTLDPGLTIVSKGIRGTAFQSVTEDGVSLLFGRIDTTGNVDYLLKYAQVQETAKFYDILRKQEVELGKITDLLNPDQTLKTGADELIVRQLLKIYADYAVSSTSTQMNPVARPQLVVDNLCKWVLPPPSACADDSCKSYAEKYRDAVCAVAGGIGDPILGAALGGVGAAIAGAQKVGKLTSVAWNTAKVVTTVGAGAIGANTLGALANGLIPEADRRAAWEDYLKCLSGKKFDENTGKPLAGCPPQLEGPNPNPISRKILANAAGTVEIRWKNIAQTGGGLLAYSYALIFNYATGKPPTVDLKAPILNLNKFGSLKPGDDYFAYLDYKCFDLPGEWHGRIEFTHNANNVSSPVDIPVNIICGGQPQLIANPLELVSQVNAQPVRSDINLENKGDADLEIKTITGVTITSAALAGAKLEIDSNPARVVLAPGSSAKLGIKGTCGSTVGVLSGYVTISSNDPSSPEKQVGVSLECKPLPLGIQGPQEVRMRRWGAYTLINQGTARSNFAWTATAGSVWLDTNVWNWKYYPPLRVGPQTISVTEKNGAGRSASLNVRVINDYLSNYLIAKTTNITVRYNVRYKDPIQKTGWIDCTTIVTYEIAGSADSTVSTSGSEQSFSLGVKTASRVDTGTCINPITVVTDDAKQYTQSVYGMWRSNILSGYVNSDNSTMRQISFASNLGTFKAGENGDRYPYWVVELK